MKDLADMGSGKGFRVQGLRFGAWGLGLRVQGLGCCSVVLISIAPKQIPP